MWIGAFSPDDILSVVLSRLKLEAFATGAFDAGGAWAIEFSPGEALTFKVVTKGECWLAVEGLAERHLLNSGDCFLISGGRGFILSKDQNPGERTSVEALARARREDGMAICNGGGDVVSIGTMFRFDGTFSKTFVRSLPPVILIPAHSDRAATLRWTVETFVAEFYACRTGQALMMGYLAPILLLQILRLHLAAGNDDKNWMIALSHPKLSRVMRAIHVDYGKAWTLARLAETAGMSRAGLAANFRKFIGVSPIEYLTRWRMQVACDFLKEGKYSIAEVASQVGYESESAFSAAFNRIVQCRPGFYRRNRNGLI
ncbi:AraC family transcriptional regulator [Stakelama sp. CBK3Z-3]|uniref:AraC family transcriptional regulator n=1 Tax=Stakelama flava TaxID=2860338 RepID=A0ABS6XI54_9SPHN|nr:AraC family transcriptional regulator [Stakelama flava]MBW4329872.1 AraC family transcriptional regulator [Stakelama flava]